MKAAATFQKLKPTFTTGPGHRRTAESADALTQSNLRTGFVVTNGTGSTASVTDTNPASNLRLYRVRREPARNH